MDDDSIYAIPNALANAGSQFSDKALQVLQIHSDLDGFSQTLHDSLPNEKSQLTIDKFWSNWSTQMLNMASEIEIFVNVRDQGVDAGEDSLQEFVAFPNFFLHSPIFSEIIEDDRSCRSSLVRSAIAAWSFLAAILAFTSLWHAVWVA